MNTRAYTVVVPAPSSDNIRLLKAAGWTMAAVFFIGGCMMLGDFFTKSPQCTAGAPYTVREGETMSSIAEKFGAGDWQDVQYVNAGLAVELQAGQVILRPSCN